MDGLTMCEKVRAGGNSSLPVKVVYPLPNHSTNINECAPRVTGVCQRIFTNILL